MLNWSPIPLGSIPDISPVFIVGVGRSGTTPLQLALNMHPQLGVYGETQAFFVHRKFGAEAGEIRLERLLKYWRGIVTNYTPHKDLLDSDEMRSQLAYAPGYAQVVNLIMGGIAARDGKNRWGEKSPAHIFRIAEIRACFPNAQIIHIVRDPRAVACSSIKAFSGGQFTDWNVYCSTRYWLRCFKIHGQQQPAEEGLGRYLLVRFEDFVTRSEKTLQSISSFLGLDFAPEMLKAHQTAAKYVPLDSSGNMPTLHALTQRPLDASRADAWKRILTPEHAKLVERLAGRQMRTLGYECASSGEDHPAQVSTTYFSARWMASEGRRIANKQARPLYWAAQRVIESTEQTRAAAPKVPEVFLSQNAESISLPLPAKRKSVGLRPSETRDQVRRSGT